MVIGLDCESAAGPSRLLLDLEWKERPPGEENRMARCSLHIETPCCELDGALTTDRDILRRFLSQARRMHRELDGSAALCDWDNISQVELQVTDKERGIIAIAARFSTALGLADSAEHPLSQEVMATVGGMTTDQSYLPRFLDEVRDFLVLADADLGQPGNAAACGASQARPTYMVVFTAGDCPVPKALALLLEGARRHRAPLGDRCLLFTTSRLALAATKRSPGVISHGRREGITFVQSALEWEGLPALFGQMATPWARGCTGMITRSGQFGAAATDEVAAVLRRKHWLRELFLSLRGPAAERYAWRRRLAALGLAAVVMDHGGTVLEVSLGPEHQSSLQRLVSAACDMGLWAITRTETRLQPESTACPRRGE
jgi:hypothetical protein